MSGNNKSLKTKKREREREIESEGMSYMSLTIIIIFILFYFICLESYSDIDEELSLPNDLSSISRKEKKELYLFKKNHTEVIK